MNNANLKDHFNQIFINKAEEIEFTQRDGSLAKVLLVRIPFRSLAAYQKVSEKIVNHLEHKFEKPTIVVANRTIISKRGKYLSPC